MPSDPQSRPRSQRPSARRQRSIWLAELLERYGSYLIGALLPLYLNERAGLPSTLSLRLTGYYLALGYAGGVLGGLVSDRFLGYRAATRTRRAILARRRGAAGVGAGGHAGLYPRCCCWSWAAAASNSALTAWLGSSMRRTMPPERRLCLVLFRRQHRGGGGAVCRRSAAYARHGWPAAFWTTAAAFGLCLTVVIMGQLDDAAALLPPQPETGGDGGKTPPDGSVPGNDPLGERTGPALGSWFCLPAPTGKAAAARCYFLPAMRSIAACSADSFRPDFSLRCRRRWCSFDLGAARCWQTLVRNASAPSPAVTLTLGMLAAALALGLLAAVAAVYAGSHGPPLLINALWVVAALTLLTVGEVLVIPVAMALVAQSAPPRQRGGGAGAPVRGVGSRLHLAGGRAVLCRFGAARFFAGNALIPVLGAILLWTCARAAAEPRRQDLLSRRPATAAQQATPASSAGATPARKAALVGARGNLI